MPPVTLTTESVALVVKVPSIPKVAPVFTLTVPLVTVRFLTSQVPFSTFKMEPAMLSLLRVMVSATTKPLPAALAPVRSRVRVAGVALAPETTSDVLVPATSSLSLIVKVPLLISNLFVAPADRVLKVYLALSLSLAPFSKPAFSAVKAYEPLAAAMRASLTVPSAAVRILFRSTLSSPLKVRFKTWFDRP